MNNTESTTYFEVWSDDTQLELQLTLPNTLVDEFLALVGGISHDRVVNMTTDDLANELTGDDSELANVLREQLGWS